MDLKTTARFAAEGTYVPDRLIADDADDLLGKGITLASGQSLVAGLDRDGRRSDGPHRSRTASARRV